jgi:iron complex outermembrane receptor protein
MLDSLSQLSIRFALGLIAFAATVAAPNTRAQDQPEAEKQTLDAIEVTGTHIRGVDLETQHAIQILTREDLLRTGMSSVADIIQSLIIANGQTQNRNLNNGDNVGNGELRINLRGLGPQRSLVLVNGHRWVNALDGGVDISTIPLALVERVEVLKDGASAIYGSDAIAGVVNIITRRNYDGAELNVHYGVNSYGDGADRSGDISFGRTGDHWSFAFGAEYGKDDPIHARDRALTRLPAPGLPLAATGGPFDIFLVPSRGFVALTPGRSGTSPDDFHPLGATDFGFNYSDYIYLQTPQERRAVFAQGRYEFTPTLVATIDALFDRRESAQRLSPSNIFIDELDLLGPSAFHISANNVYNPFGEDIPIAYQRMITLGQRDYHQIDDTQRLHLGLDGLFHLAGRELTWSLDASRTRSINQDARGPYGRNDQLQLALGPSFIDATGMARCGMPGAVIGGCVPLNLFAGPAGVTPQMAEYFRLFLHDRFSGDVTDLNAKVSGPLFTLPAGELLFAAGAERRFVSGTAIPDAIAQAGQANGNSSGTVVAATRANDSLNEVFAEFEIPLLKDRPFAHQLDFVAATRTSDYTTFGTTTNSQFSLRWRPVDDLLLRANYAQGFRAPSLFDLYQGPIDYFQDGNGLDPCAPRGDKPPAAGVLAHCIAFGVPAPVQIPAGVVAITDGRSPDLQPETSRSRTLGAAYSPAWLPGFDLTIDWYDIQLRNAIGRLNAQFFLDDCYVTGDPVSCTHITRRADGTLKHVTATQQNLPGGQEREGIDVGLAYKFETGIGRWQLHWDTAYVTYVGEVGQPEQGTVLPDGSIAGGNVVGQAVNWRWRSIATLDWSRGALSASASARYFSSLLEACYSPVDAADNIGDASLYNLCNRPNRLLGGYPANHVASVTYFDFSASWDAPWRGRFTLGVRNAFDRNPPPLRSEGGGDITFVPDYDAPGRFYYVHYRQRF